jgi:hypothetical protein
MLVLVEWFIIGIVTIDLPESTVWPGGNLGFGVIMCGVVALTNCIGVLTLEYTKLPRILLAIFPSLAATREFGKFTYGTPTHN